MESLASWGRSNVTYHFERGYGVAKCDIGRECTPILLLLFLHSSCEHLSFQMKVWLNELHLDSRSYVGQLKQIPNWDFSTSCDINTKHLLSHINASFVIEIRSNHLIRRTL